MLRLENTYSTFFTRIVALDLTIHHENIKHTIWGPNNEEDTKQFIKRVIKKANTDPRVDYDFAVILKDTAQLIGACGMYTNKEQNEGNIGWVLHMNHWKKGYGTELAHALLEFGFEDLDLHRIYATCYAENYGSYRVMERNGMRREGYFKQCRAGRPCDPEPWYDELHYAMLREEWEKNV